MVKRKLGNIETQFFAYVQMRKLRTVEKGEVASALGLTSVQENQLLSRLSRGGLITRVRRGLYLVPPRIPPGGRWSPGQFLALVTLIEDKKGRYQICGPNAFNRYGWDNQIPNRVYAYNNRLSGERQIGSVAITLIKVADRRLGATEIVKTPEGIEAVFSSRMRTLMDAVYDWSRFNSLPRAYNWICTELANDGKVVSELVKVSLKYGNQETLRRIGKLMEMEGVAPELLQKLETALRPSSSLIPWVPVYPKRGKVDRRWGIVFNDDAQ